MATTHTMSGVYRKWDCQRRNPLGQAAAWKTTPKAKEPPEDLRNRVVPGASTGQVSTTWAFAAGTATAAGAGGATAVAVSRLFRFLVVVAAAAPAAASVVQSISVDMTCPAPLPPPPSPRPYIAVPARLAQTRLAHSFDEMR